jgi:hypothetical protein
MTPKDKGLWRAAAASYMVQAEAYRMNRGYSQRRRVLGYGLSPKADQLDDCSGFVDKVVFWANGHTPKGVHVESPLGFRFSGWGNTESMQEYLDYEAAGMIQVGDIALWGRNEWDTTHTAICRKRGTLKTAIFTSHGHQSWRFHDDAPEPVTLPNFPQHLIGVFRMPELR